MAVENHEADVYALDMNMNEDNIHEQDEGDLQEEIRQDVHVTAPSEKAHCINHISQCNLTGRLHSIFAVRKQVISDGKRKSNTLENSSKQAFKSRKSNDSQMSRSDSTGSRPIFSDISNGQPASNEAANMPKLQVSAYG